MGYASVPVGLAGRTPKLRTLANRQPSHDGFPTISLRDAVYVSLIVSGMWLHLSNNQAEMLEDLIGVADKSVSGN